ncbi:glycosyltransferase family 4 protein [Pseudomonas sp. RC10]|uniref:glycosyltransferase family 4 protein n=1 Tax=Pseudomonas bambusae TaxID=3139142 RepID=UPI003138B4C9
MKRILALSFFPAFAPASNGGEARLFNFYLALSRFHHVTLLSSGHRGVKEEVINHGSQFVERRIPKDDFFARHWSELDPFNGGGDMSGPSIAASGRHPTLLHRAYIEEYAAADIIIHDSPFTVDYDLFAGVDHKPRLYNAYNCESDLYRALHPHERSKPVHELVEQAECRLLKAVDAVLYCNEDDLTAFQRLVPDAAFDALSVPNGQLALAINPVRVADQQRCSAVFMGSSHTPNVQAALFIANELAPQVPDVVFDIIGNCLPEGRYPSNVVRHGLVSVEKKLQLLQQANVALNPMDAGSGSNVKVFDYFAHSLPVLSTSIGMRGVSAVENEHVLLAPMSEFAHVLRGWRERQQDWLLIGAAGNALGREKYTWAHIAQGMADYLDRVISKRSSLAQPVLVLNDYNSFTAVGGGATRTRGLYAAVAQWCPVLFICFANGDELRVDHYGPATTVISVPKTPGHITEQMRVNALSVTSADDIVASSESVKNALLLSIYQLAKANARVIAVEHPYLAAIPCLFGDRFIYSSQNNETLLKQRLFEGHPEGESLIAQVALLERTAVERAAAVVAVAEDDAVSLTRGVQTCGPMVVVRNGAEVPSIPTPQDLDAVRMQIKQPSAVFLGSAHPPNIEAVYFIVNQLAPACPSIQFHIIGGVCGAVTVRADSNVKLWGVLDDSVKAAVMGVCTLAVNPMSNGSGSNVKLADFLGNGLFTVTTEFGQRGYPAAIAPHVSVTTLDQFATALHTAMGRVTHEAVDARMARRQVFDDHLSMKALGQGYVQLLQSLEVPRKRVLFVTYRYVSPALGGAESMIENLLRALDASGHFDIDLIAAQATSLQSASRFCDHYLFDGNSAAFTDLRHTRFARFEVQNAHPEQGGKALIAAWSAQCLFEREVYQQRVPELRRHGLAWGWSAPEAIGANRFERWALTSSAIHLNTDARVSLQGAAPSATALLIQDAQGGLLYSGQVSGEFVIEFHARRGTVEIQASSPAPSYDDPRPLAFILKALRIDDQPLNLNVQPLCDVAGMTPEAGFDLLHNAAERSRRPLGINLTDLRGPWSSGLERFLEENISQYDLVVTHNTVFRTAIAAVEQARQHGVPTIVIPHAHLDDDFYHFPDVLDCAKQASLLLAAPKAACAFYARQGCKVDYLPAGIDVSEPFGADDVAAFRALYTSEKPFVLVLGRKAGAKGYQQIIDTVATLPVEYGMQVVLIGPDDDGVVIDSPHAVYLGRQPREVVRGALMSCVTLVNMSTSESFGIVLLEAWMAGRPVVVNSECAAFHDMAIDGHNALMVDAKNLRSALWRLASDEALCQQLAKNGQHTMQAYDWSNVGQDFVAHCLGLFEDLTPEASPPAIDAELAR